MNTEVALPAPRLPLHKPEIARSRRQVVITRDAAHRFVLGASTFSHDSGLAFILRVARHDRWRDGTGQPVTSHALRTAVQAWMLARGATGVELAFVAPTQDGGLVLYWRSVKGEIEVHIVPTEDEPIFLVSEISGDEDEVEIRLPQNKEQFLDAVTRLG